MRKTWIIANNLFWFALLGVGLAVLAMHAVIPSWIESVTLSLFAGDSRHLTVIAVIALTFLCGLSSWIVGWSIARFNLRHLRPFIESTDEFEKTLFEDEVLRSQRRSRLLALTDRLSLPGAYQKPWLIWIDIEGGRFSGSWMLTNNVDSIDEYQGAGPSAHTIWVETHDAWMIDLSKLLIDSDTSPRRDVFVDLLVTLARLKLLDVLVLPLPVNVGAWEIDHASFEALSEFVRLLSEELNMHIPVVWMIQNADEFSGLLRDDESITTVWSRPIVSTSALTARVSEINVHFESIYADQLSGRYQESARHALQNLENLRRLRASLIQHYTQWYTGLPKARVQNIVFARQERLQGGVKADSSWSHGALILETSVPYSSLDRFKLKIGMALVLFALFGSSSVGLALAWKWDQSQKIEASFQLVIDRLNELAHHLSETDILEAVNALENACLECSIADITSASDSIRMLWRTLLNSVMASYVQRSLEVDFANLGFSQEQLFARLLAYHQLGMGFQPDKSQQPLLGRDLMTRVWKSVELARAWETLTSLGLEPYPVSKHALDAVRGELVNVRPEQRILWLMEQLVDREQLDPALPADLDIIFDTDERAVDGFYTVNGYSSAFLPSLARMPRLIEWDNALMNGSLDNVHSRDVELLYLSSFEKHWNTLDSRFRIRPPRTYVEWVLQLNNLADFQNSSLRKIAEYSRSQLMVMQLDATRWDESLIDVGRLSQITSQFRANLRRVDDATENQEALFEWFKGHFLRNEVDEDQLAQLEQAAAQFQPEMQSWSLNLVKQWRASILKECGRYVNDKFERELLNRYEGVVLGRFPFFESDNDMSLRDFVRYFSHDGFEKTFFESYVAPFVNVHHQPWSLRTLGHYRLPLSDEALISFYRAHVIRSSIFEHDSHEFAPLLVSLASELRDNRVLEMGWGNHSIRLTDDNSEGHRLPRSDLHSKSKAVMRIVGEDDTQALHAKGVWAWLKLLNLGHIDVAKTRDRILVTFDLNREIVKLTLEARGLDQVMEYKLYERYRLPGSILSE